MLDLHVLLFSDTTIPPTLCSGAGLFEVMTLRDHILYLKVTTVVLINASILIEYEYLYVLL